MDVVYVFKMYMLKIVGKHGVNRALDRIQAFSFSALPQFSSALWYIYIQYIVAQMTYVFETSFCSQIMV